MLKDKILLITGDTGSFGNAVSNRFLSTDHFKEIRVFSRDEKKQDDMRNEFKKKNKFCICDVRDYNSIEPALRGVDYVFHAAALKQVPSCEFSPMKAEDKGEFYGIPADNRNLNYNQYFSEGKSYTYSIKDYNSHNTERLNIEGIKKLLLKLPIIQKEVLGL